MQDKRIVNVKFPRFAFHDAMGYAFFTNNFLNQVQIVILIVIKFDCIILGVIQIIIN